MQPKLVSYACSRGWLVRAAETIALVASAGSNNEAIQTQGLREDEDEDHTNKEPWLLGISSHTCITNNTDGKAGSQRRESDSQASTEVGVARVGGILVSWLNVTIDDDGSDETIDTQHTSHDDWNDGSHHHIWSHDAHGHNANTRLGSAVCCTQVC